MQTSEALSPITNPVDKTEPIAISEQANGLIGQNDDEPQIPGQDGNHS
jgi:hypothetical protein